MSANSVFFDAQLRHATGVARYSSGEAKRVVAMLDKADAELTRLLKERLEPGDFTSKRYKAMLSDIRALRADAWKVMSGTHQTELFDLGKLETTWAQKAITAAIPIELNFAAVDAGTLKQIVTGQPFAAGTNSAKTLQQWWSGLKAVDSQRITESLQLGMTLGETVDQMVARVRAVQDLTRANAAAVVRTAVNHVSNASRESFFNANSDVIEALRWTSTLDGRTTPICQARDGKLAPMTAGGKVPEPRLDPPTARPPAHVSCRSLMIAILDANAIADQLPDRPFVRSTKTGKAREKDFRAEAKRRAGEKWSKMSDVQRKSAVKAEKRAWTKENIGQVPGATTYDEWLRRQPRSFQDDVLGPGRGDLFRAGEKLDSFVTVDGRELTLKQLRAQVGEASIPQIVADRQRLIQSTQEPWTQARQTAWEDSLTQAERSAISDWTHTWDQDIRSVQKTGQLAGEYPGRWVSEVQERINHIQTAFDRGVAREGEVYRGMALRQDDIDKLLSNETWTNTCFSSSSRKLSISRAFAFESSYGMNVDAGFEETLGNHFLPVVMRIKNRTGIDIDKLSWWTKHQNVSEAETVLRPGATYRILNGAEVDIAGEGKVWVIDMEEIWP